MKKLLFLVIVISLMSYVSSGQNPVVPPPEGQPQVQQKPDVFIHTGTRNSDLIYRVNGRDRRLCQAYLGTKLGSIESLRRVRNTG